MKRVYSSGIATVITLALAASAQAAVSLKNGNFSVSYKDLLYPGGFDTVVERFYNSKSSFKGVFGWGWGAWFEVYLTVAADGSVVAHEWGGGADNRFVPDKMNASEIGKAVDVIAEAGRKDGRFGTADQLKEYKAKLKADASYRNEEWERYLQKGKVARRTIPTGAVLKSTKYSYQTLGKSAEGYVRKFDSGKVELFDNDGHLRRVTDKNGNFAALEYKNYRLAKIQDNFNRKIFFTMNAQGLVEKIDGEGNKVATYKYNAKNELVASKDVEGNVYQYVYDSYPGAVPGRHNLSQITYSDGTSQKIDYYGRDKFENVRSVVTRDGSRSDYTYDYNLGGNAHHFRIGVATAEKGQSPVKSSYEYENKVKSDGEEWTYRMVSMIDAQKTETIYNECCGLPLSIRQNGKETTFEYNAKGQITKKATPTDVTELTYDSTAGKVKRVAKYPKSNKAKGTWAEYAYDAKGNLNFAKNNEGHGVRLVHDAQGHILSILDHKRHRVDFKYDSNGKPKEICDPTKGCIKVTYSNSGEVKSLDPGTAGRSVAQQVKTAFQNLVELLEPAGVDIGFF